MEELDVAQAIATLQQQVKQLEQTDAEQWERLDALRDRLPNWAVLVLTAGGGLIGFLAHWLASCLK